MSTETNNYERLPKGGLLFFISSFCQKLIPSCCIILHLQQYKNLPRKILYVHGDIPKVESPSVRKILCICLLLLMHNVEYAIDLRYYLNVLHIPSNSP